MSKCRICLLNMKNVRSIHDLYEDISYISMLSYVADIKFTQGNNEAICYLCSRKLRDCYFFKILIIRSDQELDIKSKIIKFDSIIDVKDILFKHNRKPINSNEMKSKNLFIELNEYTLYDTVIKKLKGDKEGTTSKDLLTTKDEYDFDDYYKADEARESNADKEDLNFNKRKFRQNICIKPKYLDDYRVIPFKNIKESKNNKNGVKKKRTKREDICPYCGKKSQAIKSHLLVHTGQRKFQCNDCPRAFYTKSSLRLHIKLHANEHSFKCDKCIATFSSKGCFNRHLQMHTDIKEYTCDICNKGFKRKNGLRRHVLIHNASAKSIHCNICNMSFFDKYTLKVHSRVHTGEKPYKCELCSQPYSYKRDFNKHCLKKHGVILDRRPVYIMNEDILKREKSLMKDLMLRMNGIPTEREPLDAFKGPQAALAFDKAVKAMKDCQIPIDIQL